MSASNASPKAALVVVDMQEDFCPPHGSLAVAGGRDLAPIINDLLNWPGFALKIATRDFHPPDHISFASQHADAQPFVSSFTIANPENTSETQTALLWPDHCVQGTSGCELILELNREHFTHIVDKGQDRRVESYSAFGPPFRNPRLPSSPEDAANDLLAILQAAKITHVFTVGLAFDYCVRATALDAAEHGFQTFVIEEGSRPVHTTEEDAAKVRKEFAAGGVEVIRLDSPELKSLRG